MAETAPIARQHAKPPFEVADVRAFVARNAGTLKAAGHIDVAEMLEARSTLDLDLKPYRGRMTSDQLGMLEKQFLERKLLESAGLPRLSLFYL